MNRYLSLGSAILMGVVVSKEKTHQSHEIMNSHQIPKETHSHPVHHHNHKDKHS